MPVNKERLFSSSFSTSKDLARQREPEVFFELSLYYIIMYYLALVNSSRKRTSFSLNMRRSFTWYFRFVIRSMPMPKA